MKKCIILLIFLCNIFISFSQERNLPEYEITGKIMDATSNQPLEYATIVLTSVKTNKVTGALTNAKGEYKTLVPKGTYNITLEYISFKTHTIENKTINSNLDLGSIVLQLQSERLDEVVLMAEKTTVEIRLDKKIFNVGKDLTVRGGTVSDVLDNVPSVSVDVEGNVALRGNENVRILINGKPSGLVGLNSTDALRQLPADAIEKVEVITSPSARYDAEGTAGILNIILRRSKLAGLNGSITANAGYPNSAGVSGNLNYRTGDFNFFTTSGYSYRESPGSSFTSTDYVNNSNLLFEEARDINRISTGINVNIGVEWYVNNSSSITASFLVKDSDRDRAVTNTIFQRNDSGIESTSIRKDPQVKDDITNQFSLNYDKKFGDDGGRLTVDFQFEESCEDEYAIISQDGIDLEEVTTLENQEKKLLQADYILPIGENQQFEIGYRGNFNTLDTDYAVSAFENGNAILNTNLSNNLIYRENINALYSQYGSKINKISFLLGLRMETSRINIIQKTTNDYKLKKYTNFFPTFNLGYELSENQSITLGYNRRIRRPRSRDINPFPSRSSETNLRQGNPDINPSFSNGLDVGYLNRLGKLTVNSSVYFQHATGVFSRITQDTGETTLVNGEEVSIIKTIPINLASNDRYGVEFTLTYNPTRKWRVNGNFNFFKSVVKGEYDGVSFDANNNSWNVRLNNKITLPGKIDWQTRLSYRGPNVNAQNTRKGMFMSNMAFSKDLFNEKASLALSVNDLFNTGIGVTETEVPGFFTRTNEFQFRKRNVRLSFTYRFKQKKKKGRGGMNGGGFDGGDEF